MLTLGYMILTNHHEYGTLPYLQKYPYIEGTVTIRYLKNQQKKDNENRNLKIIQTPWLIRPQVTDYSTNPYIGYTETFEVFLTDGKITNLSTTRNRCSIHYQSKKDVFLPYTEK